MLDNNSKVPPRILFRFRSKDHYNMVKECAEFAGLSINAWMVQLTLEHARRKLKEKARQAVPA